MGNCFVVQNPAVMAYDPTGLRTTMTASWESLEKELQKSAPTQLVHSFWQNQEEQIIAECEAKGACVLCCDGQRNHLAVC